MANHRNRLEKLEKRAKQNRPASPMEQVVARALQNLSDEHLRIFLAGFMAELGKREPTESEAAALVAYQCALEKELGRAGLGSAENCEPVDQLVESPQSVQPQSIKSSPSEVLRPETSFAKPRRRPQKTAERPTKGTHDSRKKRCRINE